MLCCPRHARAALRSQDEDGRSRRRRERSGRAHRGAERALRERQRPEGAVGRHGDRRRRHGLLLGRRAQVLAGRRRARHRRRLPGRLHRQPHLRRGVQRPHRPHRGRSRRLRSHQDHPRGDARPLLGEHDPTQGMRQGNDVGTQYRSANYVHSPEAKAAAEASRAAYQELLTEAGVGREITTEIAEAPPFYYAEPYHQQYLAKNPNGYCGLGGTGVSCPVGALQAKS
ncbi:MAG: peptide-methionine (S)-S-oxide reductase [Polyangiaceae bacterium]